MNSMFVKRCEDDGAVKWRLFFCDSRGVEYPHKVNWVHVAFDTEEEALARLAAIEAERRREDCAVPFTLDEAKEFAESHNWKFATTYAKTAPHEYLVKSWLSEEDKLLYERFVQTMKNNSVVGYFYGHENKYLILGDHYYWYMGQLDNAAVDLINRTTVDYLEYRDGAYYYKGKDAECQQDKDLNPDARLVKPGSVVKHFKRELEDEGNNYLYKIIGKAKHTETGEDLMVYQALYGDGQIYVRPLRDFLGKVDKDKYPQIEQVFRFECHEG